MSRFVRYLHLHPVMCYFYYLWDVPFCKIPAPSSCHVLFSGTMSCYLFSYIRFYRLQDIVRGASMVSRYILFPSLSPPYRHPWCQYVVWCRCSLSCSLSFYRLQDIVRGASMVSRYILFPSLSPPYRHSVVWCRCSLCDIFLRLSSTLSPSGGIFICRYSLSCSLSSHYHPCSLYLSTPIILPVPRCICHHDLTMALICWSYWSVSGVDQLVVLIR